MPLIRWRGEDSPYLSLRQEMNRLFDDFVPGRGDAAGRWAPAIDVRETPEAFVVETEIPGVDPKDVEINVVGDTLTVHGKKESKKETKDDVRHHIERTYGSFSRSVTLPQPVDTERVSATSKDGVLTIQLAKREEAKARRISIKPE